MANKTPGIGNFSAFFVFPYRGFFVCSCLKVCMPILFSHTVGFLFAMVDFFCTFCSPNVMGFFCCSCYEEFLCDGARGGHILRSEDEPLRGRG